MRAVWNGTVVASSNDTVVVEGNHYFPRVSVDWSLLRESATHTTCPWKGRASYATIVVDGAENPDAAWFYSDPLPEASRIKDRVAFWRGVEVENETR